VTADQRATKWYSARDIYRRSVRLSGVTVPAALADDVRREAGTERGAMSRAVCEALAAWLVARSIARQRGA
jgi:hypothetical protein